MTAPTRDVRALDHSAVDRLRKAGLDWVSEQEWAKINVTLACRKPVSSECQATTRLPSAIIHLNDLHYWNPQQIGEWLDGIPKAYLLRKFSDLGREHTLIARHTYLDVGLMDGQVRACYLGAAYVGAWEHGEFE